MGKMGLEDSMLQMELNCFFRRETMRYGTHKTAETYAKYTSLKEGIKDKYEPFNEYDEEDINFELIKQIILSGDEGNHSKMVMQQIANGKIDSMFLDMEEFEVFRKNLLLTYLERCLYDNNVELLIKCGRVEQALKLIALLTEWHEEQKEKILLLQIPKQKVKKAPKPKKESSE